VAGIENRHPILDPRHLLRVHRAQHAQAAMITLPEKWRAGEIAVIGLGKSGVAASRLLRTAGIRVYASDSASSDGVREGAKAVRAEGADADIGSHDLERIARASLVVASPGVPPEAPPLQRARQARVPVVSEIEIALRALPEAKVIAVTGTNGKTTTTALVGHLLRAIGLDAIDAGNIGTPLAAIAMERRPPRWIALELSSFQLHDTPGISPTVGVLTNLAPDHLDRYATVQEYYADKKLLFRNARTISKWVVNGDDREAVDLARDAVGTHKRFSLHQPDADATYDRAHDTLVVGGLPLLPRRELNLFGDHNVANALAASLAVMIADKGNATPEARARIADGLRTFHALKHRLEVAGEANGVMWINDSKATNVSSTLVAIQGMTRPTILLLGGRHKGEPYTALADPLRKIGKAVIAYGESAPLIEQDLRGVVPIERLGSDFEEVVARARALATPGDVVLLSPACSSYDMFKNYEERGATFKRLAVGGRQ
jgi:UDP-N-acetylmuramoylalanine--D-glutamate ligase